MKFLQGTYGFDIFSIFLVLISFVCNIFDFTRFLGIALMLVAVYRAFSKDIFRRKSELSKFTIYANKFLGKFGKKLPTSMPNFDLNNLSIIFSQMKNQIKSKMANNKNYKITKCPSCKQKLRVPRGKGNILVTCRKCSTKFDSKS